MTDNKSKGESTPRGDHVVVGIDGADPAHAALLWAAAEADQRGVALHIVNVKELRSGQLHLVEFEGTPVIRTWNIVHEASKVLSPAAEAFRYFMLEHAERHLASTYAKLLSLPEQG